MYLAFGKTCPKWQKPNHIAVKCSQHGDPGIQAVEESHMPERDARIEIFPLQLSVHCLDNLQ